MTSSSMQKEAIDIGITDYLVKPVTGATRIGTLKKIGQKIEEERGKQKQQTPEEVRSAGRQRLFRHMVSGKAYLCVGVPGGEGTGT